MLPNYLRKFFGRSASADGSAADTVSVRLYNAIGPRAQVGSLVRISNTGSMGSVVTDGDLYRVDPADFEHLKYGDLVIRYDEARGLNFMHRVIGYRVAGNGATYYITKGDGNAERDSNMVASEFVGLAVKTNNGGLVA